MCWYFIVFVFFLFAQAWRSGIIMTERGYVYG